MSIKIKYTSLSILLLFVCVFTNAQESYTLKQALQVSKSENLELKASLFDVEFAKADAISAKLRLNPTLENESIQLTRKSEFENNTHWYDGQNREVFWHLSKPFQWMGQRKNTIAVANKEIEIAEESYANEEREVFLDVAEKWIEVWNAQKQLDLLQTAKANIDSLAFINQKRYDAQAITLTELQRTELLARQYTIQLKTTSLEVQNLQKELGFLLGLSEAISVDTSSSFIFDIPENMDSLLQQSLEVRSDIRSVKHFIDLTESNVKLQRSLVIPQPELGVIFNPMNAVPYFGISFAIDIPFFDRNQGEIRKSILLQEQAENMLFTVQRKIETEIAIAYSNYELQKENIADFEEILTQSKMILESVRQTYLMGGTTIIDFLEAQRSWLEAQQDHYEAQQAYIESHIQLLYATGLINQLAQ